MLISDVLSNFDRFLNTGVTIEFVSGPGIGKTSMVHQGAAAKSLQSNTPFYVCTIILTQWDPPDIRGFLFPVRNEETGGLLARFTEPSVFPNKYNTRVYVEGKLIPDYFAGGAPMPEEGILFFDELGQAEPDLQKPVAVVMIDRVIGESELPRGCHIWAASNRVQDNAGVAKRLSHLQNRLLTLQIQPVYKVWEDWAMRNNIHPLIMSFASQHAALVFREEVPKQPGPFCSPRSLVLCGRALEAFADTKVHGLGRLPDNEIAIEIAQGLLGNGTAPTFIQHVRLASELPSVNDIIKDPSKARVPDNIAARYMVSMTLAHHATAKNTEALLKYIQRLDAELQILFVTTLVRRNPSALTSPEMQAWIAANQELTFIAAG